MDIKAMIEKAVKKLMSDKDLLAKFEGKGGGSPVMAQGQLNTSDPEAIAAIEEAFTALKNELQA